MTDRRDFKRRVRDRQARTGETYTEAREALERPSRIPVVETIDVTELAARLGFVCRFGVTGRLAPRAELVIAKLRDALLVAEDSGAMRALAFHGTAPTIDRASLVGLGSIREFLARVRAGIGGVFGAGRMIALHLPEPVIYVAWPTPTLAPRPQIVASPLDELSIDDRSSLAAR